LGEIVALNLYKRNQGRLARQVSGACLGLIVAFGAWTLSKGPLAGNDPTISNGIPLLLAVLGFWVIFRSLNYPKYADFLIAVEAEMDKVSWASKGELIRATIVVIFTMVFLGLSLFAFDVFWNWAFTVIRFLRMDG